MSVQLVQSVRNPDATIDDLLLTFNMGSFALRMAAWPLQATAPRFRLHLEPASGLARVEGDFPADILSFTPHQGIDNIVTLVISCMRRQGLRIAACVHRIAHGGRKFHAPRWIDAALLHELGELEPLRPLHQPPALEIIHCLRKRWPELRHIAAFDTAFHDDQPALAATCALPAELRHRGITAYGFHGISCQHIMRELRQWQPARADGRVLIAHLGHSAGMTAVLDGKSIACSMGFSTLDGLPMATRCGQLDVGIVLYLLEQGWNHSRLTDLLYHRAGLLGLSGISGDMRELLHCKNDAADFAVDYFCYRAAREIASLAGAMEGLDVLVFTGGIGEHQPLIRKKIVDRLAWLGGNMDDTKNTAVPGTASTHAPQPSTDASTATPAHTPKQAWHTISAPSSRFDILVIPADEERELGLLGRTLLAVPQNGRYQKTPE